MRTWRWLVTVLGIGYVVGIIGYGIAVSGGETSGVPEGVLEPGQVSVSISPMSIAAEQGTMTVSVTVSADSTRLDSSGGLVNPIGLTMEPVLENGFLLVDKGTIPGTFQRTIRIPGSVRNYPFDDYRTTLVVAAAESVNGSWKPLAVEGGFARDDLTGWGISADRATPGEGAAVDADSGQVFEAGPEALSLSVVLTRSVPTKSVSIVTLALMAAIGILALVAVRAVATRRRKQEMTMTSWFAALIFALLPLRLGLPGAPPLGSWIDVLVYFWVLIAVMVGLVWWILVWLRSGPKVE
jgi:hypothetical protein